jgi:hypothetical protein
MKSVLMCESFYPAIKNACAGKKVTFENRDVDIMSTFSKLRWDWDEHYPSDQGLLVEYLLTDIQETIGIA